MAAKQNIQNYNLSIIIKNRKDAIFNFYMIYDICHNIYIYNMIDMKNEIKE